MGLRAKPTKLEENLNLNKLKKSLLYTLRLANYVHIS